tara:strand:+ start:296 stop:589 length:294 start_codon:yes stop_codon:yes gene_type:complete
MSSNISIKQLPLITEINGEDLILVQTENETNTLQFSDFVVGLDNTTFGTTITNNSTNINSISGVLFATPGNNGSLVNLKGLPITIAGTTYQILVSAT